MPAQTFDIESLLWFNPAYWMCVRCRALLRSSDLEFEELRGVVKCKLCGVEYLATDEFGLYDVYKFLTGKSCSIKFGNLVGHSRELAEVAKLTRAKLNSPKNYGNVPMRGLLSALQRAETFVHFTTYGVSHLLLGALKLTAQRVPVRGVVSGADEPVIKELSEYGDEAPNLEVKVYGRDGKPDTWDATPHQKTVVIDGLLAFKGSANLTVSGWRKAALGRDVIEVVTDVEQVISLHNRFFSPVWAEFSASRQITMETDVPF